ncbi:MAG: hypothetical protein MJ230_07590 [bacterium]|nr:hypothetical protein [bacterium]
MIEWFKQFFESIGSVLGDVFELLYSAIQGLLNFAKLTPKMVSILTDCISNLPEIFIMFATVGITISLLLLVLGRNDTGSD